MAIVELSDGIVLIPQGVHVLRIKSAEGKPKAKPTVIEVVYENQDGLELKNKYPLDPKNQGGFYATSMLIRYALDPAAKTFDTDDIPKLIGQYVTVEVIHNTVNRKDKEGNIIEGKTMTFANAGSILGAAEPWPAKDEIIASRPKL